MSKISLNTNLASLNAQRRFSGVTRSLENSFLRLSSGLRINKASDDAAGLSISSGLNVDRRVFMQGVANFNDGISLLNIAEGALSELSSLIIRIEEVASQASNGTLSNQQRKTLDAEAQALSAEYSRITQTTVFNRQAILDVNFNTLTLQGGYGEEGSITLNIGAAGGLTGDGTFGTATTLATADSVRSTATGDFNGDGNLDLTSGGSKLEVYLGNGDGSFSAATTLATGGGPRSMTTGDLNGDGNLDLISADSASDRLSVLLGNGDGSFSAATTLATGAEPRSVNTGDFNGDGSLDLVSADRDSNQLSVFLGNGDGTFGAATTLATGATTLSVTAEDFNGDGDLDLVSADFGSNQLSVFLGNGDGTFGAATTLATGTDPRAVNTGDFDGDGSLDLVSADRISNQISIFLGNTQPVPFTLSSFDLTTQNSALQSIPLLKQSRNQVATQRGIIGAGINRLQVGINNLNEAAKNFADAEGRIADVDVGQEAANLIKSRILQQAGAAILNQANRLTDTSLSIIGGF